MSVASPAPPSAPSIAPLRWWGIAPICRHGGSSCRSCRLDHKDEAPSMPRLEGSLSPTAPAGETRTASEARHRGSAAAVDALGRLTTAGLVGREPEGLIEHTWQRTQVVDSQSRCRGPRLRGQGIACHCFWRTRRTNGGTPAPYRHACEQGRRPCGAGFSLSKHFSP